MLPAEKTLGRGVVTPLRRSGGDFANTIGAPLIESAIRQIMITNKGELRWDQAFGVNIDALRHGNITDEFLANVEAEIVRSVQQYEPRVEIISVQVQQLNPTSTTVIVRLNWRAVAKTRFSGTTTVLTDIQTTEVEI